MPDPVSAQSERQSSSFSIMDAEGHFHSLAFEQDAATETAQAIRGRVVRNWDLVQVWPPTQETS
jgi:hypothetical protein